jgi:cell wall-associated NlpC family hydrolase
MKHRVPAFTIACLMLVWMAQAAIQVQPVQKVQTPPSEWERMKTAIEGHLGKPYVWGATGLKSFDCSGFVWRVMADSGYMLKRTTARKLYLCLPKTAENASWTPGNIVFFDDLRHCGIVNDRDTFYHSQCSKGTNLSKFSPYWRPKIFGIRSLPSAK